MKKQVKTLEFRIARYPDKKVLYFPVKNVDTKTVRLVKKFFSGQGIYAIDVKA